jgi:hypothetical protein
MDKAIINSYIKCYLIGPMEKVVANDAGRGWRDKIRPELEALLDLNGNPIYPFDPTKLEQNKVGVEPKTFHKKLKGWLASGNNDLIAEGTDLIWKGKSYLEPAGEGLEPRLIHIMGDLDYTVKSTFIILRMEEGDAPCGTFGEACIAFKNNIPIYVLQTMARDKYPITLVGWVFASGGNFFQSQNELIEFLMQKYSLKHKK